MASEDFFGSACDKGEESQDDSYDMGEFGQELTGYTYSQELELNNNHQEESELAALKSENEKLNSEIIQLKNEKKAFIDKIEDLNKEVGHLKWHVNVYISALKNVPDGLEIYHEAFRKFRDTSKCAECLNTELVEQIRDLEATIQQSGHFSSQ